MTATAPCSHARTVATNLGRLCRACNVLVPAKANKYGANPTEVDGVWFASEHEATRWRVLRDRERCGEISELRRQVRYPLTTGGKRIGAYVADFVYVERGQTVTEDAKGFATPLYRWKRAHMLAEYGIAIREV